MGWSVSVACKSKKAQEQMLSFLEKNYRETSAVLAFEKTWRQRCSRRPSQHFAYGHSPTKIGFDKPDEYEWAILRWMAFRIGKRRKFKAISKPVPWINYDGSSSVPVLPKDLWDGSEETAGYLVDEVGWQGVDRWWEDSVSWPTVFLNKIIKAQARAEKLDKAIREELVRLDALWVSIQG